jgi:hypothetical protein
VRWLAVAALAWLSCGGSDRAALPPNLPQAKLARADTGAAPLLAFVPRGADVIIEIDLARVRANPVVGELFEKLVAAAKGQFGGWLGADLVVFCGYSVGTADASNVVIARGGTPPPNAVRLDDRTVAIGPPRLVVRVEALAAGQGSAMAGDGVFMKLRDAAMPAEAKAASVRLTARLPFDARVGLSQLFGADAVPTAISLWGDVVDDIAVVAVLSGDTDGDGRALVQQVEALRGQLMRHPLVREWQLAYLVQRIKVERISTLTRLVFVVGPNTLDKVVRRLNRKLAPR